MKKLKNIIKTIIILLIVLGSIFLIIKGIDYAKNANNSYNEGSLKKKENKIKKKTSNNTDTSSETKEENNSSNNSTNTNTNTANTTNNNTSTTSNNSNTKIKKRLVTTDPIYEYSCPDGKPAKHGDKCTVKATLEADKKYYCNEGTLEGDKCKVNDSYVNASYNYVCPSSAYTIVDGKCERSEQRDPGLKISCPKGYGYMKDPNDYNSMTCVKLEE